MSMANSHCVNYNTIPNTPQRLHPSTPTSFNSVEDALERHHYRPDTQAARIVLSAYAAHKLSGQPVWPMLVAPPGSMKTALLDSLHGLEGVYHIDQITPNTFISGQLEDPSRSSHRQNPSLLHRIGESGVIIYPDFSTVIAMNRERRAAILADMRRIYDGELHKEFGTSEPVKPWEGRITFMVAATPDVDRSYSIFQTLGERFVMVRWARPGGTEAAIVAMEQDRQAARADLRLAVHELLTNLEAIEPCLSREQLGRVAALSELAVRARTHVPRVGYNKEIIYVPEPEANTRLPQQLSQLAKGSALLDGRHQVDEADLWLVRRAAFDSIPASRRAVLDVLAGGGSLKDLSMPKSTLAYAVEELTAHGLLSERKLSLLTEELLGAARIDVVH